jgi:Na+/H+-translocating membrane pyrophosphatase
MCSDLHQSFYSKDDVTWCNSIGTPVIIGLVAEALGGFLAELCKWCIAGVIPNNAGGAWDNARKVLKGVETMQDVFKKRAAHGPVTGIQ